MEKKQNANNTSKVRTNIGITVLAGVSLVALLVFGLGLWSGTAELASAVIAPGRVAVDSNSKTISHLSGGVVRKILVADGDRVAAGQVMLRLDNTHAKASVAILEQKLRSARAAEARLLAERRGAKRVQFPADLVARRGDSDVRSVLDNQTDLFKARRQALLGEIDVHQQRISHTRNEMTGLQESAEANAREIAVSKEEYAVQNELFEKKLTARSRVLALRRLTASLEGRRGVTAAQIARAARSIGDAELAVIQARREFRENVEMALRDNQAEIFDLRERHAAARFVLDETNIVAPEAGVVVNRQVHVAGDVVRPGAPLLELVPTGDALIVEALVRPVDIDNLAVGQTADIRFTAFAQRTTPLLHGRVTYVAADVFDEPRSGQAFYKARIAVPPSEAARLGEARLQPGMPADVAIKTGQRTVLDYLLQPLRDSLFKAWRET